MTVELRAFGPEDPADAERLAAYVEVTNAVRAADAPWQPASTLRSMAGHLTLSWDGEPITPYVGTEEGRSVAVGSVSTSDWDNLHLAWLGVSVHPDHRRRGLGSTVLDALVDEARSRGRTVVGTDGWDSEATRGFGSRHGLEVRSVAVARRQLLAEVDWAEVERLHAEATERSADYAVVRRTGPTPDDELGAVAAMSEAINDAPTDDLDVEDEVYSPDRVRAYETAQLTRGSTMHRVLVRHRGSGELAGHSVVVVDGERTGLGEQHDTAVVAAHRGHRLGVLLKTEMNLWLRDTQPQLTSITTWNAESNDHMIAVNEALGYRVMGRELELQRSLVTGPR